LSSLYSIVIPTRERPDVLRYAIKTVLKQTRPNYELVVMDNCGSPETRAVVEEFADPHIRYFRSPERLSMSDNWERALEHVHGDYIAYLGDDDGLMPDAVEVAERFHRERPELIVSWLPFEWRWPDAVKESERNRSRMYLGSRAELTSSRDLLVDIYASRQHFVRLPSIYCSFVPVRLVETARTSQGRYFNSPIPDTYSGLVNLAFSEEFVYSFRPLSTWGVSRHSIGSSQVYNVGESHGVFNSENLESWGNQVDERLSERDFIVEVLVADVYLKAKQSLFPDDDEISLDMESFLNYLCQTNIARRFHTMEDRFRNAIREMATKNGLDPERFIPMFPDDPAYPKLDYTTDVARDVTHFFWFTQPSDVRTIEDFVDYAFRLCAAPEEIALIDPREPQPPPTSGARKLVYDLTQTCQERLALIDELNRVCVERQTVIDDLQRACDERLRVIEEQALAIEEKQRLIADLAASADERLRLIQELTQVLRERERASADLEAADERPGLLGGNEGARTDGTLRP